MNDEVGDTWKNLEKGGKNWNMLEKTWTIDFNFVDQLLGTLIQLTNLVLSLFMGTKMNKWITKLETLEKSWKKVETNLKQVG